MGCRGGGTLRIDLTGPLAGQLLLAGIVHSLLKQQLLTCVSAAQTAVVTLCLVSSRPTAHTSVMFDRVLAPSGGQPSPVHALFALLRFASSWQMRRCQAGQGRALSQQAVQDGALGCWLQDVADALVESPLQSGGLHRWCAPSSCVPQLSVAAADATATPAQRWMHLCRGLPGISSLDPGGSSSHCTLAVRRLQW